MEVTPRWPMTSRDWCRGMKRRLSHLKAGHIPRHIYTLEPQIMLRLKLPLKWSPYLASSPSLACCHHTFAFFPGILPWYSPAQNLHLRVWIWGTQTTTKGWYKGCSVARRRGSKRERKSIFTDPARGALCALFHRILPKHDTWSVWTLVKNV